MRIVFDHHVPRFLRHRLTGHVVSTAAREGWDERSNGRLLAATLIVGPGQTRSMLEDRFDRLAPRLDGIVPGTLVVIEATA